MIDDISHDEALLLEEFGPLEMARVILGFLEELRWIAAFADGLATGQWNWLRGRFLRITDAGRAALAKEPAQ